MTDRPCPAWDELLVTQILDTQFVARGKRVPLGQGGE